HVQGGVAVPIVTGARTCALPIWAVDDEELLEFTRKRVAKAAQGATGAFMASRDLVAAIRDQRIGLWESMEQENVAQGQLCSTADYAEGFVAFQEKRKPEFSGELLDN